MVNLKNKDMPFNEFKKNIKNSSELKGLTERKKDLAVIRLYEQATGKKHGKSKGSSKKVESVGKGLAEDKKQSD